MLLDGRSRKKKEKEKENRSDVLVLPSVENASSFAAAVWLVMFEAVHCS